MSEPLPQVSPLDDDFPEQILGKIFRHIPPDSLPNPSEISPRWAQIADRYTGRVLIIKNGKDFILDPESLFDKLSIKEYYWISNSRENPPKLENDDDDVHSQDEAVKNFNEEASEEEVPDPDLPELENPNYVRRLGLVGQFGPHPNKFLDGVFTSCRYVTGLYLHYSVFLNLYDNLTEDWDASGKLPCLKELVIDCSGTGTGDDTDQTFNHKHAYSTLYVFLSCQMFYLLEKFILAVPYVELWEGALVFALSGFLARHADTLKSFSFHQKYEIYEDDYLESDGKAKEADEGDSEKVEVAESGEGDCARKGSENPYESFPPNNINYLSLKQLGENAKVLKKVFLEEFHVVLIRPQESSPIWKNLMLQQTKFKKLIFVGDKIPLPTTTMDVNSSTLVTLRLDVRDVVNLECLKNCNCLENLTLRGKQENYDDDNSEGENGEDEEADNNDNGPSYTPPAQLIHAKSLPHTLKCVEITNLRTAKDDVSILAVGLPNLKDLTLNNVGWEGRLGLRLSDLALIWEQKRLDHFCLKSSLNMRSYSELEADPRYGMNLLGCVIQSNSFAAASKFFMEVWMNEWGYYTTCRRDRYHLDDNDIDVFQIPNRNETLLDEDEEESEEEESESGSETEATAGESAEEEEWEDCEDGSNAEEEDDED